MSLTDREIKSKVAQIGALRRWANTDPEARKANMAAAHAGRKLASARRKAEAEASALSPEERAAKIEAELIAGGWIPKDRRVTIVLDAQMLQGKAPE